MASKTPLYDMHLAHHGHMVDFAGSMLPVRYGSEKEEHLTVRHQAGMFDVSHMGEIEVVGKNAEAFLCHLLTNDAAALVNGLAHYSLMLNEQAGIIDDLIVYRLAAEHFLLCVNAANKAVDMAHITKVAQDFCEVLVKDVSDNFAQIALQGPHAALIIQSVVNAPLPPRYGIAPISLFGTEVLIARSGYTGEDGFEIFIEPANQAVAVWQGLYEAGKLHGLLPCGLAARDSLRLEAGLLLHGHDMDESTSPLEAGLMFAVKLSERSFTGKPALIKQIQVGAQKKLCGFRLTERGIAREGFCILSEAGKEIGVVTSGSIAPGHETGFGLCYVMSDFAQRGTPITIDIRGRKTPAIISKPRFIKEKL